MLLLPGAALGLYGEGGTDTPVTTPSEITLELVKSHLRVQHTDEDSLIAQYLAAAIASVEKLTGKLLSRRAVTQEANAFGCYMPLFWGPSPASLSIEYLDGDLAEQTIADARIARGRVYPADAWPTAIEGSIILSYTAGYESVPNDLIAAVLLLTGHLWANREAVSDKPMSEVPMAVEALTQPYRWVLV